MEPACGIAAVILAAGRSSRMGTSKPLLPVGPSSVIERLVDTVSRAAVGDIIVVTGHDPDAIARVLAGRPVRLVRNEDYDRGMFSSVRTGAAALAEDVEAFFILPADCFLMRTEVLERLIAEFHSGSRGVLNPCCCGVRGHPPLLSGRYRPELLQADHRQDLRGFLQAHDADQAELEIDDLTVLMDMDTPEDYERMVRFAGFLDSASGASTGRPAEPTDALVPGVDPSASSAANASLTSEDALHILALLQVPNRVVRHARAVAEAGEAMAEALKPHLPHLDVDLVRSACLLHDMARTQSKHAVVAGNILRNLGLTRLSAVVGAHMVLPAGSLDSTSVVEEHIVYLADKLVVEDAIGSLEKREADALRRHGDDSATREAVKARIRAAEIIRERVESISHRSLEEVLVRKR
jgi:CTP:molybdopterin cytidylyltransferase MocA/HD superfamily phosphohydrolase YqeK